MIDLLARWKDAAPAFGAIIALVSALVALGAFRYTRQTNRRRATLDMVLKTFMDDGGRQRYADFKALMAKHADPNDPTDIVEFADPTYPSSADKQTLNAQLNEYELISLGIRNQLFDEKIYKLWFQHQFMRDYEGVRDFMVRVREKRPSVYCEYFWLYTRWKKMPHPENKPHNFKKAWWGFTGNDAKLKAFANSLDD